MAVSSHACAQRLLWFQPITIGYFGWTEGEHKLNHLVCPLSSHMLPHWVVILAVSIKVWISIVSYKKYTISHPNKKNRITPKIRFLSMVLCLDLFRLSTQTASLWVLWFVRHVCYAIYSHQHLCGEEMLIRVMWHDAVTPAMEMPAFEPQSTLKYFRWTQGYNELYPCVHLFFQQYSLPLEWAVSWAKEKSHVQSIFSKGWPFDIFYN